MTKYQNKRQIENIQLQPQVQVVCAMNFVINSSMTFDNHPGSILFDSFAECCRELEYLKSRWAGEITSSLLAIALDIEDWRRLGNCLSFHASFLWSPPAFESWVEWTLILLGQVQARDSGFGIIAIDTGFRSQFSYWLYFRIHHKKLSKFHGKSFLQVTILLFFENVWR